MLYRDRFFLIATGLLAPLSLMSAEAVGNAPRVFAAPAAASTVPAGSAVGLGQVTFALLLVLAAVFAVAWMTRRLRTLGSTGTATIEIVSQVALGARERAVVVRVGQTHLLLGVAPGRVNLLQQLPEGSVAAVVPPASEPAKADFAALLRRSLGR
jgi:flagellar protein FliO/FliZ